MNKKKFKKLMVNNKKQVIAISVLCVVFLIGLYMIIASSFITQKAEPVEFDYSLKLSSATYVDIKACEEPFFRDEDSIYLFCIDKSNNALILRTTQDFFDENLTVKIPSKGTYVSNIVTATGYVSKINSELEESAKAHWGSSYDDHIVNTYVDMVKKPGSILIFILGILVSTFALSTSIILVIMTKRKMENFEDCRRYLETRKVYNNAVREGLEVLDSKMDIKVSEHFLFIPNESAVILLRDIFWIYRSYETKSFYINVYTKDNDFYSSILPKGVVASSECFDQILRQVVKENPKVLVGDTDENQDIYDSTFEEIDEIEFDE